MIEVVDLEKSFEGVKVLKGLNINFKAGEITCILGESGSGKSVFLQNLAGFIKPDKGHIYMHGIDITLLEEEELLSLRKNEGYLFQSGALYDFMNIFDNVAFPLVEHAKISQAQIVEKVEYILNEVNLKNVLDKYPSELSGGMLKRAALARAVILEPKMLFCDEPTSGLDPAHAKLISQLIKKLSRKYKSTTVITSHDIPNSLSIADKVAVLFEGSFLVCGSPLELLSCVDERVKDFLKPYKEAQYA